MTFSNDISILILAAGNSSRMGTPKQLLKIKNTTLLEHTLNCAIESRVESIAVVLGADSYRIQKSIPGSNVTVIVNQDWRTGMGSSIKLGLKKILSQNINTQATIILVCDQPTLKAGHINKMVEMYLLKSPFAVASSYKDVFGVPVLFDRTLFSHLLTIEDHKGAKEITANLRERLILVPLAGGEIDLDTMEDYQQFINRTQK